MSVVLMGQASRSNPVVAPGHTLVWAPGLTRPARCARAPPPPARGSTRSSRGTPRRRPPPPPPPAGDPRDAARLPRPPQPGRAEVPVRPDLARRAAQVAPEVLDRRPAP